MKMHKIKGLSITLCFGPWVRPHIAREQYVFRIGMGWGALSIYTMDLDGFITFLMRNQKQ